MFRLTREEAQQLGLVSDQRGQYSTPQRLFQICDRCNYDRHYCPGCGGSLDHGDYHKDGECQ